MEKILEFPDGSALISGVDGNVTFLSAAQIAEHDKTQAEVVSQAKADRKKAPELFSKLKAKYTLK